MTVAIPMVNAPYLQLQDCQMVWNSTTELTILAGQARDHTNVNDIIVSANVTVQTTISGAGGLDTGTIAASTLYYVCVIGSSLNTSLYAGLLTLSATAPVLPNGYDMIRRVGAVLTDGSSHFLKFVQTGEDLARSMYYDVPIAVLSGGTQTAFTTAVSCAASMPAIQTNVYLQALFTPNAASDTCTIVPNGAVSVAGYNYMVGQVAHVVVAENIKVPCDGAAKINYLLSTGSAALTLNLIGYDDNL